VIQDPCNRDVRYALRFVPGAALGARIARPVQSAAAAALLSELRADTGFAEGPSSKTHSRALVGAAVAQGGVVGLDVEYRAPGRPYHAMAVFLMDAPAGDEAAAYRMLTFREAYFKAMGDYPTKALLRVAAEATEPNYTVEGDLHVRHADVADDFALTLVWRP
jgi:hypothetical protein